MQNILHEIEEGIHIIDTEGYTVVYNDAMGEIEGLDAKNVIGKHLLDVFLDWSAENSTLLMVLKSKKPIHKQMQSYLNLRGKKITTMNSTFPIFDGGKLIGAVEISRNFTNVSHMSEKILDLQSKLVNTKKSAEKGKPHYTFDSIIGENVSLREAIRISKRAAANSSSIIIQGDTGTGKELFAQSIHYSGNRSEKPFIAQNCAALPATLLEGILFGTTKGSFTGALDRPGLFEQANGGTLFLDEINSMSVDLQAKLLRVLQEGYVRRLGGQSDVKIDVRIIAASNESLIKLVEESGFRKDLYYRLNVINVKIPTLFERKDDIPILIDHFLRVFNNKLNKDVWMVSSELLEKFDNYNWPGNVRELQNFIESAMNMVSDEHVIGKEHLPSHVVDALEIKSPLKYTRLGELGDVTDLNEYLEKMEKNMLESTLKYCKYNVSKASKQLSISRQNLQYKIKKYEIKE
jgi:arginine utilization regulatory protein